SRFESDSSQPVPRRPAGQRPSARGPVVLPRIPEKSLFQVCKYTIYLINPQFANIFFHFSAPTEHPPAASGLSVSM
ncbi:hypothetical protein, partial [Alistipes sp.]|uniref:hypothetical protein n=1 Tax=Alistipes sp. TaxID=1872444 RepID=UPI003A83D843